MLVDHQNYHHFISRYFTALPGRVELIQHNESLTVDSFQSITHTNEAKTARNIIYIWLTQKPIPRLKGHSPIVYIGQTEKSFYQRHGASNIKVTSKANKQKYNDIVRYYGALEVSYIDCDRYFPNKSLREIEGQFLWWYFRNHSEYPPINYTKTKIRNEQVEVFV